MYNRIIIDKCTFEIAKLLNCKTEYAELIDTELPENVQQISVYPKTLEKYEETLKIGYKKTLKIGRKFSKEYLIRVIKVSFNSMISRKFIKKYPKAFFEYEKTLRSGIRVAEKKTRMFFNRIEMFFFNLATFHKSANDYRKKDKTYEKIIRKLAEENPKINPKAKIYLEKVANTLFNLAFFHKNVKEYSIALREYEEALEIRRILAEENPKAIIHLEKVANTLYNLAILRAVIDEYPKALEENEEALKIFRELAEGNPKDYSHYVTKTLNNLANTLNDVATNYCFKQYKYGEAEKYYLRCSVIREELVKEKPDTLTFLVRNYGNLSWCCLFTKKYKQSEQFASKALELDNSALWIKANLAHSLLFQNRFPKAEIIYKELSSIIYQDDKTYAQIFQDDFDELEKAGAIPEKCKADVKKIIEMLICYDDK